MASNQIHVNDIGTEFLLQIVDFNSTGVLAPLDISTATALKVLITKPDGTVLTKAASFTSVASGGAGDGSDGNISYFTVLGDLDAPNSYRIQAVITTPIGTWSSKIQKFKVYPNLL